MSILETSDTHSGLPDDKNAATNESRRKFLKTVSVGSGVALSMPAVGYARVLGSNDRITVGMIGVGQIGRYHLMSLTDRLGSEVEVVALADVYQKNLDWASDRVPEASTYRDFRELLTRDDIDTVFVSSPDHWHALHTVMACEAGKDVYVEKPSCLAIKEGRKMVDAARKHDCVVQVGTQQRSQRHYQQVVELIQEGKLGEISFVRCWNYGNSYPDGIGNPPDSDPPKGLDWDFWLGPAPLVPYNENRFGSILDEKGNYTRWASFRSFWDYAGGMMTDWGVHHIDIVQWAMGQSHPQSVAAVGGKFYLEDNSETPDTISATYQYDGFVATYENRKCNGMALDGHGYGIMFHGTHGTLFVDRSGYEILPEEDSELLPTKVEEAGGAPHIENFLECVRTRQKPISDIEIGHRSSSAAILGNVAYRSGSKISWDGEKEDVVGNEAAAKLLDVAYREPWRI